MSKTPRTDAMELAVSSECKGQTDETRHWLMQAKSRELNRNLERELIAEQEKVRELREALEKIEGMDAPEFPIAFGRCVETARAILEKTK